MWSFYFDSLGFNSLSPAMFAGSTKAIKLKAITCVIVDDESPARSLPEDNIRKFAYLQLIGQEKNAAEALVPLARESVDLMFLNIQMHGLTGLECWHPCAASG